MDQAELALRHVLEESGAQQIEASLRADFARLQPAHDAIHEFMLLAPLCFPGSGSDKMINWQGKSAFLIHHWEIFQHAHRSLIEALSTYYNVAFILLRTTLELLLKGAFWECMSQRQFRDNSQALDTSAKGRAIKTWLLTAIKISPNLENELEQVSATIFDRVGQQIQEPDYQPSTRTVLKQLIEWGIFVGIANPNEVVYDRLYSRLSSDVHVLPNRIDIGKRLLLNEETEIFEQSINRVLLQDYTKLLLDLMDIAIVVELNILQDQIKSSNAVQANLAQRLSTLHELGLQASFIRANALIQ